MNEEMPHNTPEFRPKDGFTELPDDHWFEVMKRIDEKFTAEKPTPMDIRDNVLLELAEIPSGQYSALKIEQGVRGVGVRTDPKGDKAIAEYLTNRAGLLLPDTGETITSRELCDRYPDGLPEEVMQHLDEKMQKIIQTIYAYERFSRSHNDRAHPFDGTRPIHLHFLPGGAPVILVGYRHDDQSWQERHGQFLKEIGKEASVVALEGYEDDPFGTSLGVQWAHSNKGNYDELMKDLVQSRYLGTECLEPGFNGVFTEVDARDVSKVSLDSQEFVPGSRSFQFLLPDSFYEKYLAYLKREDPVFGNQIGTEERLGNLLMNQSTSEYGILENKSNHAYWDGKKYSEFPSISDVGEVSLVFTGNELGQRLYSDALAAIKLHLMGRMMNDGLIAKGPIVDYEGSEHISTKSFFLQYPEYAMRIVLRTLPELLAGQAEKLETNSETAALHAQRVFDHTDWEQVIREIFRIPLKEVAERKGDKYTVMRGENQRPLNEVHPDSWALEQILAAQPEGKNTVQDWVREMERLIEKMC
jgi:hypothetical protein